MLDVPQQNWPYYRALSRSSDEAWIRGLTATDRFALYEGLFDIVWNARCILGDWKRLDSWHWDQKVASRRRVAAAYTKLDQIRRERAAPNDAL